MVVGGKLKDTINELEKLKIHTIFHLGALRGRGALG
jgi:hypothetical protein